MKRFQEHRLTAAGFERVVLSPPKLAPAVRELHPRAMGNFKGNVDVLADRARTSPFVILFSTAVIWASLPASSQAARPVGEPQLERPTLHSLGVYWIIRDDPGGTASVQLEYRKAGAPAWKAGAPLFRVERGAHLREKLGSRIVVPADGWLFAGSALLLEPATSYELRLTLLDCAAGKNRESAACRQSAAYCGHRPGPSREFPPE